MRSEIIKQIDKLEKEFNQAKNAKLKSEIANSIGKTYRDIDSTELQQQNADLAQSLKWYKIELKLCGSGSSGTILVDKVDCQRNIYETLYKKFEINPGEKDLHETAKKHLDLAFGLAEQVKGRHLQEIFTIKAQYHHKTGVIGNEGRVLNESLKKSLVDLRNSIKLAKELKLDTKIDDTTFNMMMATSLIEMAQIYGFIGDSEKCLKTVNESMEFSKSTFQHHSFAVKTFIENFCLNDDLRNDCEVHLKYFKSKKSSGKEEYYFFKTILSLSKGTTEAIRKSRRYAKKLAKINETAFKPICKWLDSLYSELMNETKNFEKIADLFGTEQPLFIAIKPSFLKLAIKFYKKAISVTPQISSYQNSSKLASLWFSVAECYQDLRDYQNAINAYSKEIELKPSDEFKSRLERATCECRLNRNMKGFDGLFENDGLMVDLMTFSPKNHSILIYQYNKEAKSLGKPEKPEILVSEDVISSEDIDDIENIDILNISAEFNVSDISSTESESEFRSEKATDTRRRKTVKNRTNSSYKVITNDVGESKLHIHCRQNALHQLERCLKGGHPTEYYDGSGYLPIHDAVASGSLECLKLLEAYGAKIEAKSERRTSKQRSLGDDYCSSATGLMYSVFICDCGKPVCGHSLICEYLLEKASVNHKFEDGKTLLNKVRRVKNWTSFELIFRKIKMKTMVAGVGNMVGSAEVVGSLSEEVIKNAKGVIPADNEVDFIAPEDDMEDIEVFEGNRRNSKNKIQNKPRNKSPTKSQNQKKSRSKRDSKRKECDSSYEGSPERKRRSNISISNLNQIMIDSDNSESDKENPKNPKNHENPEHHKNPENHENQENPDFSVLELPNLLRINSPGKTSGFGTSSIKTTSESGSHSTKRSAKFVSAKSKQTQTIHFKYLEKIFQLSEPSLSCYQPNSVEKMGVKMLELIENRYSLTLESYDIVDSNGIVLDKTEKLMQLIENFENDNTDSQNSNSKKLELSLDPHYGYNWKALALPERYKRVKNYNIHVYKKLQEIEIEITSDKKMILANLFLPDYVRQNVEFLNFLIKNASLDIEELNISFTLQLQHQHVFSLLVDLVKKLSKLRTLYIEGCPPQTDADFQRLFQAFSVTENVHVLVNIPEELLPKTREIIIKSYFQKHFKENCTIVL